MKGGKLQNFWNWTRYAVDSKIDKDGKQSGNFYWANKMMANPDIPPKKKLDDNFTGWTFATLASFGNDMGSTKEGELTKPTNTSNVFCAVRYWRVKGKLIPEDEIKDRPPAHCLQYNDPIHCNMYKTDENFYFKQWTDSAMKGDWP